MAIANTIDPRDAEPRLARWLATKVPGAEVSDVAVPPSSGGSNETLFFTAGAERLVARVLPAGGGLFPAYDLEREFRLMDALARHTPVPVPAPRWLETDPSVLGAPFMVMPFVAGHACGDDPPFTTAGWFVELTADEQATAHDNGLQALAAVHAVDWQALGLDFLDRGLDREIDRWESHFRWAAAGDPNPTIEAAYAWVREHKPAEETLALGWGDARLANVIFGDDRSVAAVLDWETAALVDPELDLAWWLHLNNHHTDGIGVPRPPGLPSEEETVRRYEELTGRSVQNLAFYKILAGARLATLMVRVAHLMKLGGLIPADSPMAVNNPGTQMLAALLDLPAPDAAQTTTFTGVFESRG